MTGRVLLVVGTRPNFMKAAPLLPALREAVLADPPRGRRPELWDGKTADRIAGEIVAWLDGS